MANATAFDANGDRIAAVDAKGNLSSWDTASGARRPLGTLPSSFGLLLTFDPHGRFILITGMLDRNVTIVDIGSGKMTYLPHDNPVRCGAFSQRGDLVVTGTSTGDVTMWDTSQRRPTKPHIKHGEDVNLVRFSQGDRCVLVASRGDNDDNTICLWDVESGERVTPALSFKGSLGSARLTTDDHLAAVTVADPKTEQWDGRVCIWDLSPFHPRREQGVDEESLLARLYSAPRSTRQAAWYASTRSAGTKSGETRSRGYPSGFLPTAPSRACGIGN